MISMGPAGVETIQIALKEWSSPNVTCCGLSELWNSKMIVIQLSTSLESTADNTWQVTRATTFDFCFLVHLMSGEQHSSPFWVDFNAQRTWVELRVHILRIFSPDISISLTSVTLRFYWISFFFVLHGQQKRSTCLSFGWTIISQDKNKVPKKRVINKSASVIFGFVMLIIAIIDRKAYQRCNIIVLPHNQFILLCS